MEPKKQARGSTHGLSTSPPHPQHGRRTAALAAAGAPRPRPRALRALQCPHHSETSAGERTNRNQPAARPLPQHHQELYEDRRANRLRQTSPCPALPPAGRVEAPGHSWCSLTVLSSLAAGTEICNGGPAPRSSTCRILCGGPRAPCPTPHPHPGTPPLTTGTRG